jgi:hypothetical protein
MPKNLGKILNHRHQLNRPLLLTSAQWYNTRLLILRSRVRDPSTDSGRENMKKNGDSLVVLNLAKDHIKTVMGLIKVLGWLEGCGCLSAVYLILMSMVRTIDILRKVDCSSFVMRLLLALPRPRAFLQRPLTVQIRQTRQAVCAINESIS